MAHARPGRYPPRALETQGQGTAATCHEEHDREPVLVELGLCDDDDDDDLVELRVELPHHPHASVDTLWAEPIPDAKPRGCYVVRSIPRHAFGLSWGDIVSTLPGQDAEPPKVHAVVRRSGHETLRVTFLHRVTKSQRIELLDELSEYGVSYEGSPMRTIAIDVPPIADTDGLMLCLGKWRANGWADIETCEPRVAGSFDDAVAPEADAAIRAMTGRGRRRRRRSY